MILSEADAVVAGRGGGGKDGRRKAEERGGKQRPRRGVAEGIQGREEEYRGGEIYRIQGRVRYRKGPGMHGGGRGYRGGDTYRKGEKNTEGRNGEG